MEVRVDQSVKIEQSQRPTALAFSNGEARAILVPAPVKQIAIRKLRERGFTGSRATLWLFSAGLYVLLRNSLGRISRIVIDVEYPGHEDDVRGILLNFIRPGQPNYPARNITFRPIGKKSHAHTLAFNTQKGKTPADQILRLGDFERLLRRK